MTLQNQTPYKTYLLEMDYIKIIVVKMANAPLLFMKNIVLKIGNLLYKCAIKWCFDKGNTQDMRWTFGNWKIVYAVFAINAYSQKMRSGI